MQSQWVRNSLHVVMEGRSKMGQQPEEEREAATWKESF